MYGTIGHLRIKPEMEGQFKQLLKGQPGHLKTGR